MEEVGVKVNLHMKTVAQILKEAVEQRRKNVFDCQYAGDVSKCPYEMGCASCISIRKAAQVGANLERQVSTLTSTSASSEQVVNVSRTSALTYDHLYHFIVDTVKSNFKCWDGDLTAGAEWMCDNLMNLVTVVLGNSETCFTHEQLDLILHYLKGDKNFNKFDEEVTAFEEGVRIVARLVYDFIQLARFGI